MYSQYKNIDELFGSFVCILCLASGVPFGRQSQCGGCCVDGAVPGAPSEERLWALPWGGQSPVPSPVTFEVAALLSWNTFPRFRMTLKFVYLEKYASCFVLLQ